MDALTVRPFDPARDDYAALAALWTALHPDLPRAGSIWRTRDERALESERPRGRCIALRDGVLSGMGEFTDCPIAGEPGQLQVSFAVPDTEHARATLDALYDELRPAIAQHQPPLLVAYVADTQPWVLAFYADHGFEEAQRTASSLLRPTPVASAQLGPEYSLVSAAELAARDAEWMRPYHALETALIADIPFLGPAHEEPFERFAERVTDPASFDAAAAFVACHEPSGELVGISQLLTYPALPDYAFAGLTGVARAHRRRHLARALKLATIQHAHARGIERIVTLNEIDNPMLTLNLALGFEVQHIQLTLKKSCK